MTRRIALTGGIASGKSYCLEQFRRLGAEVIDADTLAREVIAPGTPGFDAVVGRFGASVLDGSGAIDRGTLGAVVFSDARARKDLEAIIHPLVYERIDAWFEQLDHAIPPVPAGIADIPLLFETGRERDFHKVVVASCPRAVQIERLAARGLSPDDAERRLAAQMPVEDKAARADYVIDTSRSMTETDRQVERAWRELGIEN